jgi:IclR family acetate operon transcriptional repressor
MPQAADARRSSVQRDPLSRGLELLTWMIEAKGNRWGVREIARGVSISPSSAHRLLGGLVRQGLVVRNVDDAAYSLDLELFRLARLATGKMPLDQAALPALRDLVATCEETAILGLYDSSRGMMLMDRIVESPHPLRYVLEQGRWLPLHAGASGLAILAFLEPAERQRLVSPERLVPVTANTLTDVNRLEAELKRIRKRGYALTHGQRIPGAVGIAAPVYGPAHTVLGDVVVTIPEQRFRPELETPTVQLLLACTERITRAVGGSSPNGSEVIPGEPPDSGLQPEPHQTRR